MNLIQIKSKLLLLFLFTFFNLSLFSQEKTYIYTDQISFIRYIVSSEKVILKTKKVKSINAFYFTDDLKYLIKMNYDSEPWQAEKFEITNIIQLDNDNILKVSLKNETDEINIITFYVKEKLITYKTQFKDDAVISTFYLK